MDSTASNKPVRKAERGNAMVEFSLCFVALMALVGGIIDMAYPLFVKGAVSYGLSAGARFAVTGKSISGQGHDDSIKQVVIENTLIPLTPEQIQIQYYLPSGAGPTPNNDQGNIVQISVSDYAVPPLLPIYWSNSARQVSARVLDVVEPFEGQPPAR